MGPEPIIKLVRAVLHSHAKWRPSTTTRVIAAPDVHTIRIAIADLAIYVADVVPIVRPCRTVHARGVRLNIPHIEVAASMASTADIHITRVDTDARRIIDRIDLHEESGLRRVLDYKTSSQATKITEAHLVKIVSNSVFPEHLVNVDEVRTELSTGKGKKKKGQLISFTILCFYHLSKGQTLHLIILFDHLLKETIAHHNDYQLPFQQQLYKPLLLFLQAWQ